MGKKIWTTLTPKKVSEEAGDQARRIFRHQSFSFLKCWKKCIFMPSISKHGYFWTLYNGIPDHHVTWPTERQTVYIMDKGQYKSERQLCLVLLLIAFKYRSNYATSTWFHATSFTIFHRNTFLFLKPMIHF